MTPPADRVFGVPLQPGERVIYFHRDDPGWQKPLLIALGVLTLVALIGVFLLIAGLMADTTVYAITTQRFLKNEGTSGKKIESVAHGTVRQVTKRVSGSRLLWIYLDDGRVRQSRQVAANAREMPALLERCIKDPRSLEALPSVPFDPVAGPRLTA